MRYRLNLDISPKRFAQGSVEVFLNWANRADGDGTEPAMIFHRKHGDRRALVAVRLSEIHRFMQASGYGVAGLVYMGMRIAEGIGCTPGDKFAARDVADLIVEYTDDLVKLPGEPPGSYQREVAAAGPRAELEITLGGQTVLETEVAA